MVGHFISRLFEGTLHADKIHMRFKIADITHIYTTRSSPPVDRFHTETGSRFAFTWYRWFPLIDMISCWNEILAWPSTTIGVNSRRGESHRHDILWWYHVKKCRAMRRNRIVVNSRRRESRLGVMWTLHSPVLRYSPLSESLEQANDANDLLILTCSEEMNRNRLLHTYRLTRLPSLWKERGLIFPSSWLLERFLQNVEL